LFALAIADHLSQANQLQQLRLQHMLAPKQTVPKPQLTNFLSFDAPVEQILQEAPKVGREEKSQSKPEPLGCNRIFQQYSVIFNPINPINPIPVSVQPSS
jgi:hypothetical protein